MKGFRTGCIRMMENIWNDIGEGRHMVLSTSRSDGLVSSRMMSVVALDGHLYFQTFSSSRKHLQLKENPRVALCFGDTQIEGRAAMEEQLHQQELQIKQFLEEASQAREDLMEQTQSELCDLSVAVAEKIIHVSLKSSREVILKMIQMATDRLKRREWVHIYVGGCTARELAQITPELTATLAGLSDHIKVIPMADDESGTCIIEMPDEIIDASVSTQLDNIKDILHGG